MNSLSETQPDLLALQQAAEGYEWVDSDVRLAELCRQWRQQPMIGLDTEFQRTDTFYPKPGLIQVACQQQCYLLDPLEIDNFAPFIELMNDARVLKLLHACSEDLELFAHCYGCVPQPLFDSQVACAFLGMGLSIGYQRLLDGLLGVELGKEETRSDWLQRPLTESQKRYAALDVIYLQPVYALLAPQLQQQQKYPWVMEECQRQAEAALQPEDFQQSFRLRFKQAWKLRPQQLAVLQALSAWREKEARQRDMPRNFLLHNNAIMAMAVRPPKTMKELADVERMRGRLLSSDGQFLLELLDSAWNSDPANYPLPPPRPLPANMAKRMKPLKALINATAERLGLAPEMLVRRKELEQLVRSGLGDGAFSLPEQLSGWREEVIGQPLLQKLQLIENESSR